jgi:hypothetical protein
MGKNKEKPSLISSCPISGVTFIPIILASKKF